MIRTLFIKELREHLLSLRFQAGFMLTFLLFAASATVLSVRHTGARRDYDQRVNREDEFLSKFSHFNRDGGITRATRPPSTMILVDGLPPDAGTESLDANPLAELSTALDLTAIAGAILSLLGVILGYDAINGEKERRTLGMVLANRLRRSHILLAKWGSGITVLTLAIIPSALAAATVVALLAGVRWSADGWLSYLAACVTVLLYACAFFSGALALSAVCSSSALSVLSALFAWVVFVFIVPNVSPYVAAQFVRVPAVAAIERDIRFITSEERDQIGQATQDRVMQKYRRLFPEGGMSGDVLQARLNADPDFRRSYEMMRAESEDVWREVNRAQQEKADRVLESWRTTSEKQFRLSRAISCAAPYPPLLFALTDLAASGFDTRADFMRQAKAYDTLIGEYLRSRYSEESTKNPSFGVNDFLDVSTRPRFRYVEPAFALRLAAALPYLGLLVLWNALFLVAAIRAFARFDAR